MRSSPPLSGKKPTRRKAIKEESANIPAYQRVRRKDRLL